MTDISNPDPTPPPPGPAPVGPPAAGTHLSALTASWLAVLVGCVGLFLVRPTPTIWGLTAYPILVHPRGSDGAWFVLWLSVAAAVTIAASVLTRHWWRHQLPAGALLLVPVPLIESHTVTAVTVQTALANSGGVVLLFGALGAAQSMIRQGRHGHGVSLAAAAVGIRLLATATGWGGPAVGTSLWLVLALVSLVATGLTVRLHRADPPLPTTADPLLHSGRTSQRRVTLAGLLVAAAALLPVAWLHGWASRLIGLTADQERGHPSVPWVVAGIVGAFVVVAALAIAGTLPVAGTLTVALAELGAAGLLLVMAMPTLQLHPATGWRTALLGITAGVIAARCGNRVPLAVAGLLATALLLWIGWPVPLTGGYLSSGFSSGAGSAGDLVGLFILAATVTTLAGAAAAGMAGVGKLGTAVAGRRAGSAAGADRSANAVNALTTVTALPLAFGPALTMLFDNSRLALLSLGALGEYRTAPLPASAPDNDGVVLVLAGVAVVALTVFGARLLRAEQAAADRVPASYLPY